MFHMSILKKYHGDKNYIHSDLVLIDENLAMRMSIYLFKTRWSASYGQKRLQL